VVRTLAPPEVGGKHSDEESGERVARGERGEREERSARIVNPVDGNGSTGT
jgi:hypothetical protein